MQTAGDERAELVDEAELDELLWSYDTFKLLYHSNFEGFVNDCVTWKDGEERLASYQADIGNRLVKNRRIAVRGPHGLGKTALAALIVWWFALTRDDEGDKDWKIITTAGTWRQLEKYLWPEIHKWARRLRWEVIGRPPVQLKRELLDLEIKLRTGSAFAVASDQPALIEGAHAESILYLFDESKAIQDQTFDAAEGAFSGAGVSTGREAFAIAFSTPGLTTGRFYDIHTKKPGFADWDTRHVTWQEAHEAGRISIEWTDMRGQQWGKESVLYKNKVLGEFAAQDEEGVIPIAWIELANQRWVTWKETCDAEAALAKVRNTSMKKWVVKAVGVDVGAGGPDPSTFALRVDNPNITIVDLRVEPRLEIMETVGKVVQILNAYGGVAIVDVVGVGAGVVSRLRELRRTVLAFSAGRKGQYPNEKPIKDESGELEFVDMRSAAWWHFRDLLNPAFGHNVALIPDEHIQPLPGESRPRSLMGELASPGYENKSGGKIRVESKDDIKERLKRSTDLADAVIQACAFELLRSTSVMGAPIPVGGSGFSKWRK